MIHIGIDPGNTGAMAIIHDDEIDIVDFDNPKFFYILNYAKYWDVCAMIENVHSMPGQGVSSTFKFGSAFGQAIGMLKSFSIPYELISPQKWQKVIFDSAKPTDRKQGSLDMARRLFPELIKKYLSRKKDHNRADALLIAEYCRRIKG